METQVRILSVGLGLGIVVGPVTQLLVDSCRQGDGAVGECVAYDLRLGALEQVVVVAFLVELG